MARIMRIWESLQLAISWACIILGALFALALIGGGVAVAVKGSIPVGVLLGVMLITFGLRILELFRRVFATETEEVRHEG